ncbi:response regulator [Aporhodopirellula aestuarii]|uniref:Response regulator n=1 Tax=Aporhodopirellula aestuarii TaxID=2950107 RepID=A0ABT0TX57_9BACT|nr:response regulator [Aporhodopirellula aestuarii]MCM2369198.1 response regulator [Aporhodopirellula aestuarii]
MQSVFEGRRCVIADDVRSSREVISRWMQEIGFSISCESDGEAAWETIQQDTCDLLITDIEMPGMSGLELIRNMRADTESCVQDVPAIVVTSLLDEQVGEVVQSFGGTTVVLKPLDKAVFYQVVDRVLGHMPVSPIYESFQSEGQSASGISRSLRCLADRARSS